jgi:coatomer protein complex subunit gamma
MGQIVDATSVAPIERLLKTAISSQIPEISSSAVLCTLYMCLKGFNIAKPWISEITDKLNSSVGQSNLLTFHTLLLIREIKDNDRLFLLKTYLHLSQSSLKSQFATCQLIRYIIEFIKRGEVEDSKTLTSFMNFLENCLFKNQQEAIILEACRGVLDLPTVKDNLLNSTFEILKNLLSNGKRVTKYATLKILNNVSNKYSSILSLQFFLELEKIIDDSSNNASLKAIALSIFLKISKGLSDYRLEKMFKTFHEQFATFKEEFKKEIVLISRVISRENSTKNKIYFNFFANLLRVEASLGVKLEITESLIWLIQNDSELKKSGILTLAEYIEDCSYDNIKTRILSVLGKEGPSVGSSSQLVRYIYNRIILENATVRAAAISSLGEIAYKEANLKKNIVNLIKNSMNDPDNEVRERAYFYVKALTEEEKSTNATSIRNYVFNPKNFDIDLLQNLLKAQKEQLLTSENIALELSNTLKDPEKMSKILMSTQKEEKQKEGSKKEGSGIGGSTGTSGKSSIDKVKEKTGSGSEEHPAMDEYKKTVFFKIYGQPKLISNVTVRNNFL